MSSDRPSEISPEERDTRPEATLRTSRDESGPDDTRSAISEESRPQAQGGKPSEERKGSFGEYELLEEIARGGMGIVYRAHHRRTDRYVALKMILGGHSLNPTAIERFQLESKAAAGLDHPGIVPVYDVGEVEGQHYYTMALVEGGSLQAILRDNPLPPATAARIVKEMAQAVQYAHERDVIHRDIKPQNVLLHRKTAPGEETLQDRADAPTLPDDQSDNPWYPRLTDFGLARLREGSGLSITGDVLGTPSYMPPEQASGNLQQIGPRSDVYSLGAVLYCALTGRPPFQSPSALETIRQVQTVEPVSPAMLSSGLSRDIETICLKCLEKEPQRRYSTARELAEDLDRFLRGDPVLARPVGRLERARRWCVRNPLVATMASLIVVLLISGTVVSTLFAVKASSNAKKLNRALVDVQKARAQEKATALRFVRFMKKNPALVRLPPEELMARFLQGNTDLDQKTFGNAFSQAPPEPSVNELPLEIQQNLNQAAGVAGSPDSFTPKMFGD